MHPQHLRPAALVGGDGLAPGVQAEIGPGARHVLNRGQRGDAHPEIIIHREVERRIERADCAPQIGAEEGGLLGDVDVAAPLDNASTALSFMRSKNNHHGSCSAEHSRSSYHHDIL